LVDRAAYEKLGTAELPKENFGVYQTMAGPVVLRRARVFVELADVRLMWRLHCMELGEG